MICSLAYKPAMSTRRPFLMLDIQRYGKMAKPRWSDAVGVLPLGEKRHLHPAWSIHLLAPHSLHVAQYDQADLCKKRKSYVNCKGGLYFLRSHKCRLFSKQQKWGKEAASGPSDKLSQCCSSYNSLSLFSAKTTNRQTFLTSISRGKQWRWDLIFSRCWYKKRLC